MLFCRVKKIAKTIKKKFVYKYSNTADSNSAIHKCKASY